MPGDIITSASAKKSVSNFSGVVNKEEKYIISG
jgi:hypothetical protein